MARRLFALGAALLAAADALRFEAAAVAKREPFERCPWRRQPKEDQCQWLRADVMYKDWFKHLRTPRLGIKNTSLIGQAVWKRLEYDRILRADFFEAWNVIKDWQACDVFAFKETWSPRDTDHLSYVVSKSKFTGKSKSDVMTEEMVKERLPTYKDFIRMIRIGDIAMVSDGHMLAKSKQGREIDSHLMVARFDKLDTRKEKASTRRTAEEIGLKANIHVVNGRMAGRQDSFLFDLDQETFLRSWCQRYFEGGDFPQSQGTYLFMWTPTALCRTNRWFSGFSRQFLYYWFVASLTDDTSLYGFLRNTTANHFNIARYTEAEQIVFEEIEKQWTAYRANASNPVNLNRQGKTVAGLAIRS